MDLRYRIGDLDFIHPAQDRDKWWALVNPITNFQVQNFVKFID
jgi:hypothetical protein